MRKKKCGTFVLFVIFIIFVTFSWLWWIIDEKGTKINASEKRTMADRPKLEDGYDQYFSGYDDYFNDHMPFRDNFITLNTLIDYYFFEKSPNENVIIGNKKNWLFYSCKQDFDPIGCYQGTNLLSEEELHVLAENCEKQEEYLKEQGKEFVILIIPNKERVYYEFMPDSYGLPSSEYQTLQIVDYLRKNTDIRVVYPYEEFMQAKETINQTIYYKTDTHWNYLGAYVGSRSLLSELGITIPKIDELDIVTEKETPSYVGDLANMMHLKQYIKQDTEYQVEGYDSHHFKKIKWDVENEMILQSENTDTRRLYVIRDSFASLMTPYVGSQFENSYWRHKDTFTPEDLEKWDPDIVVYETVERMASQLANFSLQKEN